MALPRKSKKRDAIFEVLCSTKSHPTAEWIYTRLKDELPDLSLGTVYRNLALFKTENQAVCVATVNGQERFDGCTAPHAHFICRACGEVSDVESPPVSSPPNIEGTVDSYQLNYYGTCRNCEISAIAQSEKEGEMVK